MRIDIDVKTVSEAGYDKYLHRATFDIEGSSAMVTSRYTDATNIVGGMLGSEGIIYIGSKKFWIDGKNRNITIEDGSLTIKGQGTISITNTDNVPVVSITNDGITISDGTNTNMLTIDSEGLTLNDGSDNRVKIGDIG